MRLLELLGSLKGNLDVATLQSKVISLLCVLLKEESDFTVALLLQIADDRASTELSTAKNLPHFGQIFLLKCSFKQVICVVNLIDFHLTHAIQGIESVAHEL